MFGSASMLSVDLNTAAMGMWLRCVLKAAKNTPRTCVLVPVKRNTSRHRFIHSLAVGHKRISMEEARSSKIWKMRRKREAWNVMSWDCN